MFSRFDNMSWKSQFPTLHNDKTLAYFDSAASSQTQQSVLDRMNKFYEHERCNVNRGDFPISQSVSEDIEVARSQFADLISAKPEQLIFTAGATHGLNIIANWYADMPVVIISEAEHTSNILPWLAQGRTVENGRLVVLPLTDKGTVCLAELEKACESYPYSLLSLIGTSNVSGITNPIKKITKIAHNFGVKVAIDYCQTTASKQVNVNTIDHAVFSGHKMYGPTGIGVLYSRLSTDIMPPASIGGGIVNHYDFNGNVDFYEGPAKHEAGTPNIAGILGLGIASEWINFVGYDVIRKKLADTALCLSEQGLFNIDGLNLLYPDFGHHERNVYSFTLDDAHPSDISILLGLDNVAIRVGKVCAHPYVNKLTDGKGILRVSTGVYNTEEDCEKLVKSLCKAMKKIKG